MKACFGPFPLPVRLRVQSDPNPGHFAAHSLVVKSPLHKNLSLNSVHNNGGFVGVVFFEGRLPLKNKRLLSVISIPANCCKSLTGYIVTLLVISKIGTDITVLAAVLSFEVKKRFKVLPGEKTHEYITILLRLETVSRCLALSAPTPATPAAPAPPTAPELPSQVHRFHEGGNEPGDPNLIYSLFLQNTIGTP